MHKNRPCIFDLKQRITVFWNSLFFFLETKKYTGKPKFGKVLNNKARRARTQKILETGGVERIIISTYYKRMTTALTYVPVHLSQNPRQNSTKII